MTSGHEDFKTIAVMRGVFAGEQITLSVDALGRLRVQRVNISDLAGTHADLDGLDEYDHDQYVRKNLSQAITGAIFRRNVDGDLIQIHGGTGGGGTGANIRLYGAGAVGLGGDIYVSVPNAAHDGDVIVFYIEGDTDNPVPNFNARRLTNCADPTAAQDAVTLSYLEAHAGGVDSGLILAWSGSIATIPTGFLLCDGANGTPNLRNRFIVGAGSLYAVNETGGAATHTLTVAQLPYHDHKYRVYVGATMGYGAKGGDGSTGYNELSTSQTGSGQAHNNMPPYYALAWVMKA